MATRLNDTKSAQMVQSCHCESKVWMYGYALERHLETQSYWLARMGQISLKQNPDGVTFQDSDLAKLPEPLEGAWQTGRLNPAFGQSEIEKRAFKEVFQAIQRVLDSWRTSDGTTVEAYVLKELKINAPRLLS